MEASTPQDPTIGTPPPTSSEDAALEAAGSDVSSAEPGTEGFLEKVEDHLHEAVERVEEFLHIDQPAAESSDPRTQDPGWVDNPLQTGSTGFASGGGDLAAGSPALAHHLDPIAGEGEGGGESGAPNLSAPGNPEGGDTTPSASQP